MHLCIVQNAPDSLEFCGMCFESFDVRVLRISIDVTTAFTLYGEVSVRRTPDTPIVGDMI